jgi:anti-anti-sigma regulatory factor
MDSVGHVDTAALQVLVSARRTAAALGRELVLARPSEAVRGVADRLGLERALFGPAA